MVGNISGYFRAMTDVSAEHDKFTAMKQNHGESAIAFRARLVSQVRLCKYSEEDQIRFVRSQLLKGMSNRELARTARMFNYDTEFVVQSATRCEAFEEETNESGSKVLAVGASSLKYRQTGKRTHQVTGKQLNEHRIEQRQNDSRSNQTFQGPPSKRLNMGRQGNGTDLSKLGRRSRCSRCDRPAHRGRQCPALNKNCRRCGNITLLNDQ
ncbi:uncharacterized protein LOC134208948 [Armigeres subalbatus]|uniref:uncharacterized protein LOC134208948 n=1 Tax=Armigeres subalbatus TaxID=124917 RepID=UPI002ED0732D